jgi:hypothetical protein
MLYAELARLTCPFQHVVDVLQVSGVWVAGVHHVRLAALPPCSTLRHRVLRFKVLIIIILTINILLFLKVRDFRILCGKILLHAGQFRDKKVLISMKIPLTYQL